MFDLKNKLVNWEECFSSKGFEKEYYYEGELGSFYTKENTLFRLWCPVAFKVVVKIYKTDGYSTKDNNILEDDTLIIEEMVKKEKGIWEVRVNGDWKDRYYTYEISYNNLSLCDKKGNPDRVNYEYVIDGETVVHEIADIYGKASGTNGIKSMIIDLNDTNPIGWNEDKKPKFDNPTHQKRLPGN